MYHAADFDEAIAKAERLVADGGYGHTSSLYINKREKAKIEQHYEAMKTCRILINTPSSHGGIGDLYNFPLAPSLTLGCGSWGGNPVSENVGVKDRINIKTVKGGEAAKHAIVVPHAGEACISRRAGHVGALLRAGRRVGAASAPSSSPTTSCTRTATPAW